MSAGKFPPVTRAQWSARVERDLKGRPASSLNKTTAEGMTVAPLYLRDDLAERPRSPLPAGPAWLRAGDERGWLGVQELRHIDPRRANAAARAALERGAHGCLFVLDGELQAGRELGTPADGLALDPARDLGVLLEGIEPGATLMFDAGLLAPELAEALEDWLDRSDHGAALGPGSAVLYDPLAVLARRGSLERSFDAALGELVDAVLGSSLGRIAISTAPYHNAGATGAEELALALATAAELLRRGAGLGLEPSDFAGRVTWRLPVAGRPFEAIAKLRAARTLWAKLTAACGLPPEQRQLWIHAASSQREWTAVGPWVNLLRGTVASFAGAVGGADSLATASFDALCRPAQGPEQGQEQRSEQGPEPRGAEGPEQLGPGSELGQRLAINTQVILREESGLDRVVDPAGGSWFVEALTDELARTAWQRFRAIEAAGGVVAELRAGAIQASVVASGERLQRQIATRRRPITGVSSYAVLDEPAPPEPAPDTLEGEAPEPHRAAPTLEPAEIPPFVPLRLAAPFEDLRRCGLAGEARLFVTCLGPLVAHQARAEFAADLFRAGGFTVIQGEGADMVEAAVAGFRASGCRLVAIAGRDESYGEQLGPLLVGLRAAGAVQVWVTGTPPEVPASLEPELPPGYLYRGCDALEVLEQALAALGLSPTPDPVSEASPEPSPATSPQPNPEPGPTTGDPP